MPIEIKELRIVVKIEEEKPSFQSQIPLRSAERWGQAHYNERGRFGGKDDVLFDGSIRRHTSARTGFYPY